jgi:Peptidase family M28
LAGGMGKGGGNPKRFPGADDNGSGSTTLMELARRFGAIKNRQGRRLVIMWFTGEELGLLGSKHYAQEPLFPLDKTAAMVNMDMVGRLNEKNELVAEGFETGKGLQQVLDKLNEEFKFTFVPPMQNGKYTPVYGRSDQQSFYNKKIPSVFFFSGFHPDYHKQTDFADRINVTGMAKVATMAEKLIAHLLTVEERPEFQVRQEPNKNKKKGGTEAQSVERALTGPERAQGDIVTAPAGTARGPVVEADDRFPQRTIGDVNRVPPLRVNGGKSLSQR